MTAPRGASDSFLIRILMVITAWDLTIIITIGMAIQDLTTYIFVRHPHKEWGCVYKVIVSLQASENVW
jgi:hypothetical protein